MPQDIVIRAHGKHHRIPFSVIEPYQGQSNLSVAVSQLQQINEALQEAESRMDRKLLHAKISSLCEALQSKINSQIIEYYSDEYVFAVELKENSHFQSSAQSLIGYILDTQTELKKAEKPHTQKWHEIEQIEDLCFKLNNLLVLNFTFGIKIKSTEYHLPNSILDSINDDDSVINTLQKLMMMNAEMKVLAGPESVKCKILDSINDSYRELYKIEWESMLSKK